MKASTLILSISLLISSILIAQNPSNKTRLLYNLTITKTNEAVSETTEMVLDFVNDTSYFAEKKFIDFQNDLHNAETYKTQHIQYTEQLKKANKKYNKSYFLLVKSSANENQTFEKFNNKKFYTTENKNSLEWTIDETPIVWNNYTVKKASTICDGRLWTVYFTDAVGIKTGPYKFNNLPGFVVKAWDKNNNFIFEYSSTEDLNENHIYLHNPHKYSELTVYEKKLVKEVFYPHLASKNNDLSRATGVKLEDIENPIDLSFVEELEFIN